MAMLTREQLLTREKLEIKEVDLGNGDFIYVREMYANEKNQFEMSIMKEVEGKDGKTSYKQNLKNFQAKLAVNTICDQDGNNVLLPNDVEALATSMGAKRMNKIILVAQELNKITEEDKEKMLKNSDGGETADSSSASA
jgi:hypothetical protein